MGARTRLILALMCALLLIPGGLAAAGPGDTVATPSGPSGGVATTTPPPEGAFLSLHFGRSQWEQRDSSCSDILPDTVTLLEVAQELAKRRLKGVGHVVVDRTSSTTTRTCELRLAYPTWDDLALLRDTFRWSFVSAGQTYANMTTLTPAEQRAESCSSLRAFREHGHTRAHGLFAYPNNKLTTDIQTDVVSTCFGFGRKYGGGTTKRPVEAPYLQTTVSFNGGACNDLAQPCSDTATHGGRRYALPSRVAAAMQPQANQWSAVQFYRFVVGTRMDAQDPALAWDCSDPDVTRHWTSKAEIYCWEDYKTALDQIPANVIVTDPVGVGRAWGRLPLPLPQPGPDAA